MGFVSAIELQKPVTRKRISKGVAVSTISNNGHAYLQVRIDNDTLKEARIEAGDHLDLLFDKEGRLGLIKRVKEGGWMLTGKGESCARVRVRWAAGLPFTNGLVECADVTADVATGIMFQLPEGVKFEGTPTFSEAAGDAE
jgi:hypothetical protein